MIAATARLLRLELRHNAMLWMAPVAIALFWLTTYRKAMAMPPLWYLRATSMQLGAVVDFITPVVGAAAWMGSRGARRRMSGLLAVTARPRWTRLLVTWAATTCWALAGYLVCLAVLYGVTAHQARWGGPLWWPAVVVATTLPALSALGFAAGTLLPSKSTAPVAAVAAFFAVALSTELITGSQSYWQVAPLVTGPWDLGPDGGVATFYPYLPDLSMAQVMFLAGLTVGLLAALAVLRGSGGRWLRPAAATVAAAGLLAAGTAAALAGTGTLDANGMITIPALHDAASDQRTQYTPACGGTAIPVCLNPAYASYLPAIVTALTPLLSQIAGLPGAPARISQATVTYQQHAGNRISIVPDGPVISGRPPVYHLLLPDQLPVPSMSASDLVRQVWAQVASHLVARVIGDGPGASRAQQVVATALLLAGRGSPRAGLPGDAAIQRFTAMPAPAQHAWLVRNLTALRAGQITVAQLP